MTIDTNDIIRQVHLDLDKALTKARDDINLAVSTAELKLNELMQAKNDQKSAGRQLSFLYTTIMMSIGLTTACVLSAGIDVNILRTELLSPLDTLSLMRELSPFQFNIWVFTAALIYHVVAFFIIRSGNENGNKIRLSPNAKVKIELGEKGCQTDPSLLEEESENELGSASSVGGSLNVSDNGEAFEDCEKVYHKAYVTPMRLVENEWKEYGPLHLNISSIDGKRCMVFRNDIGVLHMNLPIAKGMTFEKVKKKFIRFVTIEDEVRGMECFMLKVSPSILDKLYSKLAEMASE